MLITYIVSGIKRAVFFEHTALALRSMGYETDFILIGNHSNDFELFLEANQFSYTVLDVKSWKDYFSCIRQVKQRLQQTRPAIVHTHLVTANVIGLIAAKKAGIKCRIYTRHSGTRAKGDWKVWLYDRISNHYSTHAIAITGLVKEILLKQGYPAEKAEVIHYGFDLDRLGHPDPKEVDRLKAKYNPSGKHPFIGMIARPVEWKGIQYAIPAFAELLKEYPNACLALFNYSNESEYRQTTDELLRTLPEGSYITVPFEPNVYDLYQLFDLFVHLPVDPDVEAFGQVYVEALATGVPSVFTMSGIARDFIEHKQTAWIVDFRNTGQVYDGMKSLLQDKTAGKEMAQRAGEAVGTMFTVDYYMQKLIAFYKKAQHDTGAE
jgi:glycosyltransferase involved in cell wall biosynthesis